jgi:transcriptional regulator with XRE-family HTH domain/tetratricopeptide (TPR) repeat protein
MRSNATLRHCARCGSRLASDNNGLICRPCERAANASLANPPQVPPEFWENDQLRDSLVRERHIGHVIRSYRHHPYHGRRPIPQEAAARWLSISQAQLARIERGKPVYDLDRLINWARILAIPPELLWFSMPDDGNGNGDFPGNSMHSDEEDEDELSPAVTPLQAARRAKGWSQGRAVWEITNLAAKKKMTVASARSLKTQLSRWENGHVTPDYYRPLLSELFWLKKSDLAPRRTGGKIPGVTNTPAVPLGNSSPEPGPDTIVLNLLLDGKEVVVPISRRFLLRAGVSSFVEAFALDQQFDMVNDIMQHSRRAERLAIASPAHLQEIFVHLREQWHALVKTDNLLGPRFALAGVLNQISVVEALRSVLRDEQRIEVSRLGAKYAESAAWLYEDTDNMTQARFWTNQAMERAYEGDDERMLAWTIFRRAQQAAVIPDAAQTIGLAQAARRNEEKLATPTRAAIRVQEAYGHALDGNDRAAQRLLDEAHTWAAGDIVGDAREGHGSYCTPGYIEIQRGHCWLATGQPKKAISLYEDSLRTLPTVYQRNRAAALTRLAAAYAADSQPEQAANTAHAALPVARSAGSKRIVGEIKNVGTELIPYRALPAVATLLDELEAEDH